MWKTLSDWLFAVFNMSRELQELRLQSEVAKLRELPALRGKRRK